jgi:hypothetical protein
VKFGKQAVYRRQGSCDYIVADFHPPIPADFLPAWPGAHEQTNIGIRCDGVIREIIGPFAARDAAERWIDAHLSE